VKKAWQTTEFWTHVITNLVGFAVIFGALNAEQGAELTKALTAIAGAVLSICSTLGYMKARVEVKKARLAALGQGAKESAVKELNV
jgi:hypothetical protein